MPVVNESIVIDADIDAVYRVVCNMEQYPHFMQDVESVTIIERNGEDSTTTEWVTNVEGTPIVWTEVDEFDCVNYIIRYRLIEGDLDKFDGEWQLEKVDGGVKVSLSVDYDFGIPNLTELIGPTLDIKVRENSQMMLAGMKAHIEGKKTTPPAEATSLSYDGP